ncbi:GNAT family N-acetyltransferase [Leptospira haakeii]|uniref:GNAT family N-acetyltransferase n=1 Tax=Leptospira haakeii TaxID=2023198 RepID=A0ABX4PNY4_9LEPT|nr:GNAT family N-acetyltransferase [Leptospira haakeii]PKA16387.1 GNAT family N-acetyltransferase [Leptospira haakeii]PKA19731.1 GNAT family N-acetyltransferase [Leptospira haakeii]
MSSIETISNKNIDEVLPLIRKYQEFYKIESINDEKNRKFFSQFGEGSNLGCLFGFRKGGRIVGFATIYFSYASSIVSKVAIMNDLFTLVEYRKNGIGESLIVHCAMYAKSQGAARLQWVTAPDNLNAQALYNKVGAKQSSWEFFTYTIIT